MVTQAKKMRKKSIEKRWNALDWFIARIRYNKILRTAPFQKKDLVVCDIGCGIEGNFLSSISDRIAYGYGFDMKTENRKFGNIELKQVDDLHDGIPLPDNSVDLVFLIAVLEHLSDPQQILKEIRRILKLTPPGRLVLTTPTPLGKPVLEFLAFKLHIVNEAEILDHKHYYTGEEIRDICQVCGLEAGNTYHKFWFGMNSIACAIKNTNQQ